MLIPTAHREQSRTWTNRPITSIPPMECPECKALRVMDGNDPRIGNVVSMNRVSCKGIGELLRRQPQKTTLSDRAVASLLHPYAHASATGPSLLRGPTRTVSSVLRFFRAERLASGGQALKPGILGGSLIGRHHLDTDGCSLLALALLAPRWLIGMPRRAGLPRSLSGPPCPRNFISPRHRCTEGGTSSDRLSRDPSLGDHGKMTRFQPRTAPAP
ncbi:hypothetical protein B0J13DRAFT_3565 [Dactylonectria estremocensis]|uniref:Uncharacterized protein n=1 Tax=Dactylonectria estremocensis TaxID=1079267 RepID=A0A9P9FIC4_9HYPO|nr:hypothetical protein B0J13DRAFT_3565 [Dactylonectria estremocensis]